MLEETQELTCVPFQSDGMVGASVAVLPLASPCAMSLALCTAAMRRTLRSFDDALDITGKRACRDNCSQHADRCLPLLTGQTAQGANACKRTILRSNASPLHRIRSYTSKIRRCASKHACPVYAMLRVAAADSPAMLLAQRPIRPEKLATISAAKSGSHTVCAASQSRGASLTL